MSEPLALSDDDMLVVAILVRRLQVLTNMDHVTVTDQELADVARGWVLEAWRDLSRHTNVLTVVVDAELPDPVKELL